MTSRNDHLERAAARGIQVGAEVQAGHQLDASRIVLKAMSRVVGPASTQFEQSERVAEQINSAADRAMDSQLARSTPMTPGPK